MGRYTNSLDSHSYLLPIDSQLSDVLRNKIENQLREVGFDDERQKDIVGSLSGGWKMRLELARAMLYNADLLLLDEVCPFIFFLQCHALTSVFSQRIMYVPDQLPNL